jgi:hypothetical protein
VNYKEPKSGKGHTVALSATVAEALRAPDRTGGVASAAWHPGDRRYARWHRAAWASDTAALPELIPKSSARRQADDNCRGRHGTRLNFLATGDADADDRAFENDGHLFRIAGLHRINGATGRRADLRAQFVGGEVFFALL